MFPEFASVIKAINQILFAKKLWIILLTIGVTETYQISYSSQPTKLMKTKNIDIVLRCLLVDKHERFNQNASVNWSFKKACKGGVCWKSSDTEGWVDVDCGSSCGLSLELNDRNTSNGFYMCKMFPYQINEKSVLHVEVTKSFEIEIIDPLPPPELLNDTPDMFSLPMNSQLVLQCKFKSLQRPITIKWFRKQDESTLDDERMIGSYNSYIESSRSIKYYENFYDPLVSSSGLKEITENVFLSKLILNNVTQSSIYVCVAINYSGFSNREIYVNLQEAVYEDYYHEEDIFTFEEKNYEILILIPIVLLMPSSVLLCFLFYLLINRQIMRSNKNVEIV